MSADSQAAMLDVYQVCLSEGVPIELFFETESTVTRDDYGSIISRSATPGVTFYCHPIEVNPSAKVLEKVGIRETVDILIYFSAYEWALRGKSYRDIDLIRGIGQVNGENYKLVAKRLYSNYSSDYLYIVLGGLRN